MRNILKIGLGAAALLALASAHSSAQTFMTAAGATNPTSGNPVDAEAVFTASAGVLTVDLTNLLVNPTDVSQNITDIFFTLNSGLKSGTLGASSGQEISIDKNGVPTLGSTVSTGWGLDSDYAPGFHLNDLGHAGPTHSIIGLPGAGGTYSNANGSIAGNKAHNPFLNQTAEFHINIPNMTADDFVSSATFSFGTVSGENVGGGCVTNCGGGPNGTPEPGTMALLMGAGVPASALCLRKRIRR